MCGIVFRQLQNAFGLGCYRDDWKEISLLVQSGDERVKVGYFYANEDMELAFAIARDGRSGS